MIPDARTAGALDGLAVALLDGVAEAVELGALDDDGLLSLAQPLRDNDAHTASVRVAEKTKRVVRIS